MGGTYYQSEGRSGRRNESDAESNECGEVPTVDTTLFTASYEPPRRESSCDDGNRNQDGHCSYP